VAHPGDNLNPFVVIGVLLVIVTILSCLIVWAAGPITPPEDCPCNPPPYDGFIVTP
jgi:hypothetical protein